MKHESQFTKDRVTFVSDGTKCYGYIYLPLDKLRAPCILLANGFSGTMDYHLPSYAERFAIASFSVLLFDYRYFGESEGEPRQLIDTRKQREDIQSAIRFLKDHQSINSEKIVLLSEHM